MNAPSPSDPLGYDAWLLDDIDPMGRDASGLELIQQAIYHRLTTDKLLLVGAPGDGFVDYGFDVRRWIGEPMTQEIANAKGPLLAVVLQREDLIDRNSIRVSVDVERTGVKYEFRVSVTCRATSGLPVALVLGVSDVTVDLLAQGR